LKPRTSITFLNRLALSAILLAACALIGSGQDTKDKKAVQTSELANQAEAYFQEAVVLSTTKERELSRSRLMQAKGLWLQINEPDKAARACLQMGDCCKQNKEYQASLYYYNQALDVKPSTSLIKARAFASMAQIYADIFQIDLSLTYYETAIGQARAAKDLSTQALAWVGLANLYHQRGERERAIKCIAQARQLNRQQQNESAEAELLHLTGIINQEKGMMEQAKENFEEATGIFQRLRDEEGRIKILCSLSNLYLVSSQKQAALEAGELAESLAEKRAAQMVANADIIRVRDLRWRASLSRARALRAVGQKELAIKSFRWTIHQLEGLYWTFYINTEASAAAFREACQVPYVELADLLVEQGDFQQAYVCAQQAKARVMTGLIQARRNIDFSKKPEQEAALREISRSLARLRAQWVFSRLSPDQQAKIEKDIKDLERKMDETRLRFEMEQYTNYLNWPSRPSIKQLQEQMAQEKSTILDFLFGNSRSFVWCISANNISFWILPGKSEIEKTVNQYLALINTAPNNLYVERDISKLKEQAENLFRILFGQLSEQIVPGQKLIIVPDGVLHYLPFEALVRNKHYLIEDHEISYVPSVSLLVSGQNSTSKIKPEDKMELLAFGDPDFGATQKAPSRKEPATRSFNFTRGVWLAQNFQLDPIPRTRDEVQYIASLFPPGKRQVYLGKASTERAVKHEVLRRYRRLHFATHSLIDEKSPSRSSVVLSLNDDPEEDGFLEVGEIAELVLDSDLVVLSACQTGHGQLLSGEGIIGMSRSFLYAGARDVIVSLWNVSDISTSQLMKNFYQRLVNNATNALALREAKLPMITSSLEIRHPYYWAPFIVIGKP
jgi:CHAT domain-containing protein